MSPLSEISVGQWIVHRESGNLWHVTKLEQVSEADVLVDLRAYPLIDGKTMKRTHAQIVKNFRMPTQRDWVVARDREWKPSRLRDSENMG